MDNKQTPEWEELPFAEEEMPPLIQELDFQAEPSHDTVPDEPEALTPGSEEPAIEEPIMEEPVIEELPMDASDAKDYTQTEEMPISLYPQEEDAFTVSEPETETESAETESDTEVYPEEPDTDPVPEAEIMPFLPAPEPSADQEAASEQNDLSDSALIPAEEPAPPRSDVPGDEEYQDAPATVPAPEKPSSKKKGQDSRPTLKGRPKRKKGEGFFGIPNILATAVWLSLILTIGVTLGRMLWVCAADVLAFGREDKRVTITVYEADSMEDVVDKLYEAGLIRYKSLFNLYASISDAEEEIKPGIYDLNTRYDYHALVNSMSPSSSREVIELTIPEGYTCRQIFALLEENRVCTAQDIAAYAADGVLSDYWFLEGLERGSEYCLEGYLFPDTYQFYKNSSPREALEKMLDNFDYRFTEEMRAQIDALNANVTDGTYGVREIVIVASLIEKESAAPVESPTIASVIYNRLFNWDYPALLNIDAAIVYAQGGDAEHIDTSIDSPYNTYRYTGLTPTAIANPGLASLKAALKPENTDYYFYVLNPSTGMHQFSETQAEHDAWIDEFYN